MTETEPLVGKAEREAFLGYERRPSPEPAAEPATEEIKQEK
jgi:hypothetical protein